jgi:hypothetical protein
MRYALVMAMMFLTAKVEGQVASQTTTTAGCTAVVVGHDNTINCGSLTIEEAQKLAEILNEVRNSNLSLDIVLGKLDAILAEIRRNENPNRGVVSYDANGSKRTTSAGKVDYEDGEHSAFLLAMSYDSQRLWQNELDLAKTEEQKIPEWLTPIMFEATANANLCHITDAASKLNDFIAKASDEPAYKSIVALARQDLDNLPRMAEQCHVPYP